MVFSLFPILSMLVCGSEVDEKDESIMLQYQLGLQGRDNGRSAAIDSLDDVAPFNLYFDSKTKYESHRKRFPTNEKRSLRAPMEMALRFKDLAKQGIAINGTHAVFPMGRMTQAQFVRKNRPLKTSEFGVANLRWLPNLPSVFKSIVTGAEKLHVLYTEGSWREDSYKYALKDQAEQTARANELPRPSEVRLEKTTKAMMLSIQSGLGMQFVRAATDPFDVASAVNLSGKPAPSSFSRRSKQLQKQLSYYDARITAKAKQVKLNKDTAKGTGNNCFHLQDSTGDSSALPPVALTPDGNGFAVRLDTLVQSFRGETTFAPLESFSFSRGGMVFSHDTVANELLVYHQSSAFMRAEDIGGTQLDHDSTFHLGSLTPRRGALEPDGRTSMPSPSDAKHALWVSYKAMPMDYKHLFNSKCIEGDSDGNHAKAQEAFSSFNTMEYLQALGGQVSDAEQKRIFMGVAETIAANSGCLAGLTAASIPNSHGFGINSAIVVLHMLMEIPPSHLAGVILDPNWNRMDLSSMALSM